MKTYTHPTINLPAGQVVVRFYDDSKSGTETTPDIIEEIGDVEEGTDIKLGDVYVSSCKFILHNKSGYVIDTLFNTEGLKVRVNVNGQLYFYGFIDFGSLEINDLSNKAGVSAINLLALLSNYTLTNYKTEAEYEQWGPAGYNPIRLLFSLCNRYIGASSWVISYTNFLEKRKFRWNDSGVPRYIYLDDVLIDNAYWNTTNADVHFNAYGYKKNTEESPRLENMFKVLGELSRDFLLACYLVENGPDDFLIKVAEKDADYVIATPTIKEDLQTVYKFDIGHISTDLNLRVENGFPSTNYNYYYLNTDKRFREIFKLNQHWCNILAINGAKQTNMLMQAQRLSLPTNIDGVLNWNGTTYDIYTSFNEAIINGYKKIYFNNKNWKRFKIVGLQATYGGNTGLRYLNPFYRFLYDGTYYRIHSLSKSLMKNESELLCVKVQ